MCFALPADGVGGLSAALGSPPGQDASPPGLDGNGCRDKNMSNYKEKVLTKSTNPCETVMQSLTSHSKFLVLGPLDVAFPSGLQFSRCTTTEEGNRSGLKFPTRHLNHQTKHENNSNSRTETLFPRLKSVFSGKQGLWEANEDLRSGTGSEHKGRNRSVHRNSHTGCVCIYEPLTCPVCTPRACSPDV